MMVFQQKMSVERENTNGGLYLEQGIIPINTESINHCLEQTQYQLTQVF